MKDRIQDLKIKNFLLTRFNLKLPNFETKIATTKEEFREWCISRKQIFFAYCLNSVLAQAVLPHKWLLLFDSTNNIDVFEDVLSLNKQHDFIVPVVVNNYKSVDDAILSSINMDIGDRDECISITRMDNDDALSILFIKMLNVHITVLDLDSNSEENPLWLTFNHGVQFDGSNFYRFIQNNNAFVSTVFYIKKQCQLTHPDISPLSINHTNLFKLKKEVKICSTKLPLWLQFVHEGNVLNKIRKNNPIIPDESNGLLKDIFRINPAFKVRNEKKHCTGNQVITSDIKKMQEMTNNKFSEMAHSPRRLNYLIEALYAKKYLEIGVLKGATFKNIIADVKYAVDIKFLFDYQQLGESSNEKYFQLSSDDFFAALTYLEKFDVVFLDGLHTFEQTYRDFCNTLIHTTDHSVILIDDTLPNDPFSALKNQSRAVRMRKHCHNQSKTWHGDVYKLVLLIHDFYPSLDYITIVDSGNPQTLVWRADSKKQRQPVFNDLEKISRLSYFDLIDNFQMLQPDSELVALEKCVSSIFPRLSKH